MSTLKCILHFYVSFYINEGSFGDFDFEPLFLPLTEYAHVVSEINTNLTNEERKKNVLVKPVGDCYYTFINKGFNDYIIIGKKEIANNIEEEWSNQNE